MTTGHLKQDDTYKPQVPKGYLQNTENMVGKSTGINKELKRMESC